MKYSEFNKKYADLELQYTDSDVYIYCDGVMVGKISKEYRYKMSTHYDGFEQFPEGYAANLLMNMNMLSETPLSEREEDRGDTMKTMVKTIDLITPEEIESEVNKFLETGDYQNVRIQWDMRKMADNRYYSFAYITYEVTT